MTNYKESSYKSKEKNADSLALDYSNLKKKIRIMVAKWMI